MAGFISPWQVNQFSQGGAVTSTAGETFQKGKEPIFPGLPPPSGTPNGGTQSTPVTGGLTATAGATTTDASKQAALARLGATATGQNVPVTAAQKAGMVSTQSDMSAAAEAQQNAALRRTTAAGGGSLYDPSHGAAERENASDRQVANQQAVRDIDMGAQAQNFEAQFAADRLLASQDTGGGGYSMSPGGGASGPSATPGGDRVRGYGGMDLSQSNLIGTASNGIRQPTTTRQPTTGGQASGGSTGGQTFAQWDEQQKIQEAQRQQAMARILQQSGGEWRWATVNGKSAKVYAKNGKALTGPDGQPVQVQ